MSGSKILDAKILEVDAQYPEKLCKLHNNLPFLPEIMKIEKVEKLISIYMIKLKTMFWKKVQRMIKFNQNAWLKPYIDMNTKFVGLRAKAFSYKKNKKVCHKKKI